MDLAYNLIIAAVLVLLSPYWGIRMAVDPAFRDEILIRVRNWKTVPRLNRSLWIHASSVGEVRVAQILIRALQRDYPDRSIVLSTFTATGQELAGEQPNITVFRLPLDLRVLVRPLIKRLDPAVLILIEAEYWPNLLRLCGQRNIPVLLANGRLSERSLTRYQKLKPWFLWLTEPVSLFAMRSQTEADRLAQLGISKDRIRVTGNMKYDALPAGASREPASLSENGEITVVFGSTRPGEEAAIAKAVSQLNQNPLNYKFIIAPRHVQRCGEVKDILERSQLSVTLLSELEHSRERWTAPVLLVDRLGVLGEYYQKGNIAFVGGGFDAKHGGHNILEPALLGLPVLYGRHMANFEEEARLLADSGGGIPLDRLEQLAGALESLLINPAEIRRRGRLAAETVQRQQGAVVRNLELIQSLLEKGSTT